MKPGEVIRDSQHFTPGRRDRPRSQERTGGHSVWTWGHQEVDRPCRAPRSAGMSSSVLSPLLLRGGHPCLLLHLTENSPGARTGLSLCPAKACWWDKWGTLGQGPAVNDGKDPILSWEGPRRLSLMGERVAAWVIRAPRRRLKRSLARAPPPCSGCFVFVFSIDLKSGFSSSFYLFLFFFLRFYFVYRDFVNCSRIKKEAAAAGTGRGSWLKQTLQERRGRK